MAAQSPMYLALLQDLNRSVAQSNPEDVLQYCSNYFNTKLEEQRIAGRAQMAEHQAQLALQARSKSLAASAGPPPAAAAAGGIPRKKQSLPSLVGAGYSFGSQGKSTLDGATAYGIPIDSAGPSPFSESVPPLASLGNSFSSKGMAIPPVPKSGGGGISWNKSFAGAGGNLSVDSDEENAESSMSRTVSSSESRDKLGVLRNSSSDSNGIPTGYNLGRRTSVSAESIDPNAHSSLHPLPKVIIPKTSSQRARIENSIEKNLLFRNLDQDQHEDILNAMKEVKVERGTKVIVQGAVGDFFYVVEQGKSFPGNLFETKS